MKPKIKTPDTKAKTRVTLAESLPFSYQGEVYDILLHALVGKFTGLLSPASFSLSMFDWLAHLAHSPAKQLDLTKKSWEKTFQFMLFSAPSFGFYPLKKLVSNIQPVEEDKRFKNEAWHEFPFNLYAHAFLLQQQWWDEATTKIRGVAKHREHVVNFTTRQILDIFSPSNFVFTNPEVLATSIQQKGMNFIHGMNNFVEDLYRKHTKLPPAGTEQFRVGENIAITPGKVVFRNRLIELIQYKSETSKVYGEPILIAPAWIMKYYILDLSPHNSLVKYLVKHGHTVFMISWKNPDGEDRNLGLEDYLNYGIMDALTQINQIVPNKKINTVGYCLGGTLLAIAAAYMASHNDDRLQSITLLAAQVDFKEPGELSLFIDQSQITYLEDIMWEKGYLDGAQMAWTFNMLQSNDLIWSRIIHNYLLGKRKRINDLIAWNYDVTRLPYKMHSEYLHSLFLNNDLTQGRFKVNKKKIALVDITVPIFAVGTIKDHVSPWKSVYKISLFTDTEVTFVLTNGGHNAGIVSEPGHPKRNYQISTRARGDKHVSTDNWLENTPQKAGSWWPAWQKWLTNNSSGKVSAPSLGNSQIDQGIICDAPGTYVLQQ